MRFGSSWMMVVGWDQNGSMGQVLLTHSQSTNADSPHYDDQTCLYSKNNGLRPMLFKAEDIVNHTLSSTELTAAQ